MTDMKMVEEISVGNDDNPCRVLVVDDDKPMRGLLKALVESLGAVVVGEAEDGEEAVRIYGECIPDLTFLDIQMPVKNGMDALKEIIKKDPTATVIMLTATSDMAVADSCVNAGARTFIRKAAAPNVLRAMVKMQLDSLG